MPVSVNINTKREHFIYIGKKKERESEAEIRKGKKEINSFPQSISSVETETTGNGLGLKRLSRKMLSVQ